MDQIAIYREFLPESRLRPIVECFWVLQTNRDHWRWVLPDGCVDLLLRFDATRCSTEVVETMTEPRQIKIPRGSTYLGVRFKPGMAKGAFPLTHKLRHDRILAVEKFGRQCDCSPHGPLESIPSIEDRIKIIGGLIQDHDSIPRAQCALNAMAEKSGNIGSEELCDLAHLGERQFRRYCVQRTGVAPKRLAGILRFRKACELLKSDGEASLSKVAVDTGYFDQAHFKREFKALSRQTPGRFQKSCVMSDLSNTSREQVGRIDTL